MSFDENDKTTARDGHDDWQSDEVKISLDIHDLPHKSSNIEWWYYNGHLNDYNQNRYSIFGSFFRTVDNSHSTTDQIYYLHALT